MAPPACCSCAARGYSARRRCQKLRGQSHHREHHGGSGEVRRGRSELLEQEPGARRPEDTGAAAGRLTDTQRAAGAGGRAEARDQGLQSRIAEAEAGRQAADPDQEQRPRIGQGDPQHAGPQQECGQNHHPSLAEAPGQGADQAALADHRDQAAEDEEVADLPRAPGQHCIGPQRQGRFHRGEDHGDQEDDQDDRPHVSEPQARQDRRPGQGRARRGAAVAGLSRARFRQEEGRDEQGQQRQPG